MIHRLLVILGLASCLTVSAQNLSSSRVISDSLRNPIQGISLAATPDNGCINLFFDKNSVPYVYAVTKLDSTGSVSWSKYIPGCNLNVVRTTNDSCYVIAGSGQTYPGAVLIKLNKLGDTIWTQVLNFNGGSRVVPYDIKPTRDSGFVVCGTANGSPGDSLFVAKFNRTGNLQWASCIVPGNYDDYPYSITELPDGTYLLSGSAEDYVSPSFFEYALLCKLSHSGTLLWSKKYNTPSSAIWSAYDAISCSNGFLVYMGYNDKFGLMLTDTSGNVLWTKFYRQPGILLSSYPKLHATKDQGYVFCTGYGFMKTDTTGNLLWSMADQYYIGYFFDGNDLAAAGNQKIWYMLNGATEGIMIADSLGQHNRCLVPFPPASDTASIVVHPVLYNSFPGGTTGGPGPGVISKVIYSDTACLIPEGILEHDYAQRLKLYPNPASGLLTIEYQHHAEAVQLVVYDLVGKIIYLEKSVPETNHLIKSINVSNLDPGIYMVKLITNSGSVSGKFIISR